MSRVLIKAPVDAPLSPLELAPFDLTNAGRSVPMVWYYRESLNVDALVSALEKTLAEYPVFCGRYDGQSPPTNINLNNAGVPVEVSKADVDVAAAFAHIPTSSEHPSSVFLRTEHEPYVPAKAPMDPDGFSADAPLLAIKITTFPQGTAIGLLVQHCVADADAAISFVRNWSRVFRGLPLDPKPIHDRGLVDRLFAAEAAAAGGVGIPAGFKVRVSDGPPKPEFMGVMPTIMGQHSAIVPVTSADLVRIKAADSAMLSGGAFVSTDDSLTARAWKALCEMRCQQLELPSDSELPTTCSRAWNFRKRTEPPLGDGYCANAVSQVWSELTVGQMQTLPFYEVARRLRESLQASTSETVANRAHYLRTQQKAGARVVGVYDENALTFIFSSWRFDWEGAAFEGPPLCFDHGALVAIACVFVPRPNGDGLNVYASGPEQSLVAFTKRLLEFVAA